MNRTPAVTKQEALDLAHMMRENINGTVRGMSNRVLRDTAIWLYEMRLDQTPTSAADRVDVDKLYSIVSMEYAKRVGIVGNRSRIDNEIGVAHTELGV